MKSVKHVSIDSLDIGDVLLVDTEDECLKMILERSEDDSLVLSHLAISNLDENEIETDRGHFMVSNIKVGEPIQGVTCPERRVDQTVEIGGVLTTKKVVLIEVYQDED